MNLAWHARWTLLFLWPAAAAAQTVTVPQPLARAAVPCEAAAPPCETVPEVLSRHAAVGDSSTLHRYAWEVLSTLSRDAPPLLREALGDVRRNYYRFIWVDAEYADGEPAIRTLLVHLDDVPDAPDSLPGIGVSAVASGPALIDVFASDDPDAVLRTQYISTRLEDPRPAQIPGLVEASGVIGFLAGAVARTRGEAAGPPATTYSIARARLPFRRSNVTIRDTVVVPGSAAALREAATDLRDGLMIREARSSRCAQALATSHAAAIATGATQGACSAPQGQASALNAREAAACRDELLDLLAESYRSTAGSCQDTPPDAGFDPLLVVDTTFTELVESLRQTRRTSESNLVNVPRTRYSFGLLSGAILGTPTGFGSTVRARVGDEGTIVQDPLPTLLNMVVVNIHPLAYDPDRHSIGWSERFRFFAGTVVSPDFGVGGGAGVMILRGLAANVGWATLFVSSPKTGLAIGDTPLTDADPLRIGRAGVFFAGLTYSFE